MSQLSQQSVQDAEALHKAFKGLGMDEKVLIEMLTRRTVPQIMEINQAYVANFGKSLHEKIESEAGKGHFGTLAKGLAMHPAEFDATLLHKATKGLGTDEDLLIEVLMGRSNVEVTAIKAAYANMFGNNLEHVVASELSGDMKKLFVIMLQGVRDEEGANRSVEEDVKALYDAGEGRIGTDETKFMQIIGTRAPSHLEAVIRQYALTYGHDLAHAIKKEMSGDLRKALESAVRCLANRPLYLAELFEKSMAGIGTNDEMLVRLLVRARFPKVMSAVKEAYLAKYGKTLSHRVGGETSGDYKKLAVALIEACP